MLLIIGGSTLANYFSRLSNVEIGDIVKYRCKYGIKEYKIDKIKKIDSFDWSMLEQKTSNLITLITCINGEPNNRLCVQATQI